MWIAKQEISHYEVRVRNNGKFAESGSRELAYCLFDWGWEAAKNALANACHNSAAVACLNGNAEKARKWLDRAKSITEIS